MSFDPTVSRIRQTQDAATSVTYKNVTVPDGEVVQASDENMPCVNITVVTTPEGALARLDGAGDKFYIPAYMPVVLRGVGDVKRLSFERDPTNPGDPITVCMAVER